jgi:hypothetical protein
MASHLTTVSTTRAGRSARTRKRWLAQLIPGARELRTLDALATGMSGLALAKQSIALELAASATPRGVRRSFLVRAQTLEARTHVCSQLQEHYAQAQVRYLESEEDPLQLDEQEEVSCVELRLGAPPYLPLRTWSRQTLTDEGSDPLLNVLAALKQLPPRHRAVAQLVLTPASDRWSRRAQRLAHEHPLEAERLQRQLLARTRTRHATSVENELFLEGLGILLILFLIGSWLWQPLHAILPAWIWRDGKALLRGQMPHFSLGEIVFLSLIFFVLLTILVTFGWLYARVKQAWKPKKIYDPALVRQKTERIAYRAALRLYVIGPRPGLPGSDHLHARHTSQFTLVTLRSGLLQLMRPFWWKQQFSAIGRRRRQVSRWMLDAARLWTSVAGWRSLFGILRARGRQINAWRKVRWLLFLRQRGAARTRHKIIVSLMTAFRAYHLASGNFFVPHRLATWRIRRRLSPSAPAARVLARPLWRAAYLTPEEVASLYHPLQDADLRNAAFLERGGARTLPVPWQLAAGGGEPFGTNMHAGVRKPVFFPRGVLGYNLLALAGTGKGKSTLFAHLARALFADPTKRGMVLIDPHGDLAQLILGYVPQERRDEVVYLNLADKANPPGLNFLDMSSGQDLDKVVDMIISIFKRWWKDNWGSRIENTVQYCVRTLCSVNRARCLADPQHGPHCQATILSIVPLLTKPDYREALIKAFKDDDIWDWWHHYYQRHQNDVQQEIASSVITKISKFRASKTIRRIMGQPVSSVSLSDIVRNGRILVVTTSSGVVGDDTSTLCGSMLLGLLRTAIAEQATRETANRTPIYVFLDEMQHYTGVDLNVMMAELRKYGGNFALATQSFAYLDALDKTLKPTLLTNTDQLFAFDASADDAEIMAKEIGDGIEPCDILALDNFACYAKLTEAGAHLPACSVRLFPPPSGDPEALREIQLKSQQRYGRPKAVVDKQLRRQDKTLKEIIADTPPPSPGPPPDEDGLSPDYAAIVRDDWIRHAGTRVAEEPGGMP